MIATSIWLLAVVGASASQPCHKVEGDRILAQDLTLAEPRLTIADGEQALAYSPEPGATRVFWPAELARIALRSGSEGQTTFSAICFERKTRLLQDTEILDAIRVWAPNEAKIELLDRSQQAVPVGPLVIPKPAEGASRTATSTLLRGYVLYGNARRYPVWVRAHIHVDQIVITVKADIPAGAEVLPEQVSLERRESGIGGLELASRIDQVAGQISLKHLRPGDAIALSSVQKPRQVNPGSMVNVEVRDGATRLVLKGLAVSGGRTGDVISIRNLSSGKAFRALVNGDDSVLVSLNQDVLRGSNSN